MLLVPFIMISNIILILVHQRTLYIKNIFRIHFDSYSTESSLIRNNLLVKKSLLKIRK